VPVKDEHLFFLAIRGDGGDTLPWFAIGEVKVVPSRLRAVAPSPTRAVRYFDQDWRNPAISKDAFAIAKNGNSPTSLLSSDWVPGIIIPPK